MDIKPRICFVGPMLGSNSGWVINPMEILVQYLKRKGYSPLITSSIINRYLRFADVIRTIIQNKTLIDVLCIQVYGGPSFIVEDTTSWLGQRLGHSIVMVLRGGALPEFMKRYPRWSQRVLRRAQVLITPSAYLAHTIQSYGFNARVIPNAIDITKYPYRHRDKLEPRLLWMRTFHEIYNPAMALDVFVKLKQKYPEATLTMAGQDRGLLKSLKRSVGQKRLNHSVRFIGFLDIADKQKEFPTHDIFLNTNRVDNMPVSVVEAAAFGLPVVATKVGGIPFLLTHEKTALLVRDNDVKEMSRAILTILSNPNLAHRLSVNGRRMTENFDWARVIPLWEEAFLEAVKMRR